MFKNNNILSNEELIHNGYNDSKLHIDFMIGTEYMEIEAKTNKGKVLVFKKGNFNI